MTEATRGNIEWLIQEDPELFSTLAEKASQLILYPEQRLELRDEFSHLVEKYNLAVRKAGVTASAHVAPTELTLFANEICTYFFEHRKK